ncbi:MAG: flavodoxin FldA [Bacteroidales bacterium]|jgi:flavodoxin I|nr:flavodoxin FldA [Bacteroidales bacterium]MBP5418525.1 flavodoxin FldA [Bacteroidales bacterium]MCR5697096.1 flavodoxin FldA [Marinilabiliaceae bacterium]
MSKKVIFYGSTTGTTEEIAGKIGAAVGAEVFNVTELTAEKIAAYDTLILGTSTWGAGELQDDWYDGVKVLKSADLKGKTIALFGCGDSSSYCDTFCDAMGVIYQELAGSGATFVGQVATDGYSFDSSASVVDGKFVGLAIDEVNESNKTDERIAAWVKNIQ